MAALSETHMPAGSRVRRTALIVLAVLAMLGLAFVGAIHYATRSVEARVLEALGPDSEVDAVTVGLHEVRLAGLRVKAPKGWPTDTALRAEEVVVTPKLKQLFSDRVEITEVRIHRAYLSALRPKGGGGLRLLPSVTERAKKDEGDGKRGVAVRAVRFENCTIDLYDATVPLEPQRVRIDDVTGSIEGVEVPDRGARTKIDLDGALKGPVHRGTVSVQGWVDVGRKSSELTIALRNVDLAMFEPYIFTRVKAGVESGTFSLDLKTTVRDNVLHAPGTLTISGLRLRASESPMEALASLPRKAGIGALADEQDRITVPFELEGSIDDPSFSIARGAAFQAGIALIKAFGLSIEGLIRALAIMLSGLGSGLGSAV
ncbi:MAG TPA: DUF748 domain-containing protein [Burkholderiales bacterium]|nr:DUF748 domain-containing protein [Burkholderiales bacterium]